MRLEVNHDRGDGEWTVSAVYLTDGKTKYGLNPNAPGTIRIFGPGTDFEDHDLERLALIHRLLTEARGAFREQGQRKPQKTRRRPDE